MNSKVAQILKASVTLICIATIIVGIYSFTRCNESAVGTVTKIVYNNITNTCEVFFEYQVNELTYFGYFSALPCNDVEYQNEIKMCYATTCISCYGKTVYMPLIACFFLTFLPIGILILHCFVCGCCDNIDVVFLVSQVPQEHHVQNRPTEAKNDINIIQLNDINNSYIVGKSSDGDLVIVIQPSV